MTGRGRHSSSSDDSSPSASSRSSSPTTAVPKAYARLENDSEQVQTLVDREKEKMYRKRPYSVSLSSGSELDLSPESNIPKAYSRKKKKIMHEDGNSLKKSARVPSSSSSSSSSDSSGSSSSSSDSSSDSESEHYAQNQHKKNPSSKDRIKDNRSGRQHRSNHQSENSSRKEHEEEKKLHQRRDRSRMMVAESPEEIRHKKREVEDRPRSSSHTDVAKRSYSQEINYRDSMSRGRNDKTHRHRIGRELRRDQEPTRDESSKKNNHKEKDFKRDGSQSEKDRRYYDRFKEVPRDEGSNSRRREEERYKGGDAQKMVHKSSRTAHAVEHSQSRAKSSQERDRRKIDEVSKQGFDHERFSPADVYSTSKSKSSKEKERQRVKHESSVSSVGREYFSTEKGCWEWELLEEPSRKAPDELRDQASHRHDRRQNSREGRTDSSSRHSVKESSHAERYHKRESLAVDSKRTVHSSVSPAKTKSDSSERRKRKIERAKEKERARLKKEKRKRRDKLERRKAKKKERREHRSKKSKEKRRKERKERRSKEPKGPKISSIQAKLLNLAEGVQEPAPRILAPMTKEEYERKQSQTRRVYDEDTGRHRLVRGEGEIIEEIVSRDRHRQINKQATRGDGISYQRSLGLHRY